MRILSLETATHFGGVACIGPAGERSDGPWASRASSLEVLAAADRLLAECGVEREALDLVVVSTGPGLFTGVRVGLSIAKTLVWAQGPGGPTRLVAVPTLDAVAALAVGQPGVEPGDLIAAVTDARRGEVYAALYSVPAGPAVPGGPMSPPVRLAEDLVERPAEALRHLLAEAATACGAGVSPATLDRPIHLIGDGAERYADALSEALGPRARPCDHRAGNLPLAVARLGLLRAQRGETAPPEAVHPHYVRRPDAVPPTIE
jgi:tRNA threonylcarbamoyl adenosine modification protein YeaZ